MSVSYTHLDVYKRQAFKHTGRKEDNTSFPNCVKKILTSDFAHLIITEGNDTMAAENVCSIGQKVLAEGVLAPEKFNVLLVEAQVLNVLDDLLQAGGNGKAAPVGHGAEKNVEVADLIRHAGLKIAVGHGELVEIAEQGIIHGIFFHFNQPFSMRRIYARLITVT